YGPDASLSVTHATVTERLKAKKAPRWLGNAKAVHTFTYTPDAGRSLAMLGNTASAYGQVWHALTSKEPITGEQYVRIACELSQRPYALQVVPRWMLFVMGTFVPVVRESGRCSTSSSTTTASTAARRSGRSDSHPQDTAKVLPQL